MGDNRVIYSRRSLSFSCLSTRSNLLVRSVFPKSLVLTRISTGSCNMSDSLPESPNCQISPEPNFRLTEKRTCRCSQLACTILRTYPLKLWKCGHEASLVYSGTINVLEVLQQRDDNACRDTQVNLGIFLNTN